jgi:hypothetical protein
MIDKSRSTIDSSRVMLQLVASFMIIICYRQIFIVQATGQTCGIIMLNVIILSVTIQSLIMLWVNI